MPWAIGVWLACGAFFAFLLAGPAQPFRQREPGADGRTGAEPAAPEPPADGDPPAVPVPRLRRHDDPVRPRVRRRCSRGRLGHDFLRPLRTWLLLPWTFLTVRDRARRLVGLRGARLGRLLGLGSGRERVVPAVADRDRGAPLGAPHGAQGHPEGLDRHAGAGHVPAHDPRHVHDALGRLQLGALVHAERDRPDDPGVPGAGARLLGRAARRCASTGSRPEGALEPALEPRRRCSWSTTCCSCCSPSRCCSARCSRWSSRPTRGVQMSVGRPYFDRMAVPIGVALLFLMGVGPGAAVGPRDTRRSSGRRSCRRSSAPRCSRRSALALGVRKPWTLVTLAFGGYTAQVTLRELWLPLASGCGRAARAWAGRSSRRSLRRGRRRFGVVRRARRRRARDRRDRGQQHDGREPRGAAQARASRRTLGRYTLTFLGVDQRERAAPRGRSWRASRCRRDGRELGVAAARA